MKYYNNIKSLLCGSLLLVAGGASLSSCTDWLDKDPEAIVAQDEAFKNFRNFQGYIEEIYKIIPNKEMVNYCTSWNWGDDAVHNPEGFAHMDHQVDLGNYRNWWTNGKCWLNGAGKNGTWGKEFSLWKGAWYSIRKCNQGMLNIKSMVGSDEERDLLLGQMYFFRAWWHFELMCYFGGLPYVDQYFNDGDHIPELPRLSFQECANRCAQDFEKAYELLPMDWDDTPTGVQYASGKNDLRVNKFMALCYLGKCYLWAGSPLMKEFEKTKDGGTAQLMGASSNGKTYDYDRAYCLKAAEALGKALNMVANKTVKYKLVEFNYANIYDHEAAPEASSSYSDLFYTEGKSWLQPGSTEAIFRGVSETDDCNWNCSKIFGPKVAGLVPHDNIIHHPTANLIDQYGMANGQPIYLVQNGKLVLNPNSGWDPTQPYKGRDPRFYHDIVFDGFDYIINTDALDDAQKKLEYCSLYTGGAMRAVDNASSTGYFIQKLVPHQCNEADRWCYGWEDGHAFHCYLSYMRLADIYLMYAEAQAAIAFADQSVKTLKTRPEYCPSYSAVDAINVLHDRINMEHVPDEFLNVNIGTTGDNFLDYVRNERAVELSFEGFRWCDLQRWLLLTEPPYTVKYSHEFNRLEKDSWYKNHDPRDARVEDFHRETLIVRDFKSKHYWFPLPDQDVYLYPGFPQNPGW